MGVSIVRSSRVNGQNGNFCRPRMRWLKTGWGVRMGMQIMLAQNHSMAGVGGISGLICPNPCLSTAAQSRVSRPVHGQLLKIPVEKTPYLSGLPAPMLLSSAQHRSACSCSEGTSCMPFCAYCLLFWHWSPEKSLAPSSACLPFRCLWELLGYPRAFSSLNRPSPLSLFSQERCSQSSVTFCDPFFGSG